MTTLLGPDEPHPVSVERAQASSAIFLSCDHASNRIPRALDNLGLPESELQRHIAWDIGAAGVSRYLSNYLDATLVLQNYSRLVIDCNRPHDHDTLVPTLSEATEIPANRDLDPAHLRQRREEIFHPYHETIAELLDQRLERPTVFVSIHSFTPAYLERARPWHVGILTGDDRRVADPMLQYFGEQTQWCVGDNEPYRIDDKDYGIPVHGEQRVIPHVLIELRQDLIADDRGQRAWAAHLAEPLQLAANIALGDPDVVLL